MHLTITLLPNDVTLTFQVLGELRVSHALRECARRLPLRVARRDGGTGFNEERADGASLRRENR